MDRIQTILISAFQYENTQVPPLKNDKAPTWWPKIVREYDPKKWATSPDPDSYPVDDIEDPIKLGYKEVYDFVMNDIMPKLTPDEKKVIYIFIGNGYLNNIKKISKKMKLPESECLYKYETILFKIKNFLPSYLITIYFRLSL